MGAARVETSPYPNRSASIRARVRWKPLETTSTSVSPTSDPLIRQQFFAVKEILFRIVGLVLQENPVLRHAALHQIVGHAPGLGDRLVAPLAPGGDDGDVRVLLPVVQGGVQPVLEQNGGVPLRHYTAAQNDHHLGVVLDVVVGAVHHRAEQSGKHQNSGQRQGGQGLPQVMRRLPR